MMCQQFYLPLPALRAFVNNIMIHHVTSSVNVISLSIPPLPENALMFYVRERPTSQSIVGEKKEALPASMIIGPQVNRHILSPGKDHLMIKVGFQPGGLYRFLGIPMAELLSENPISSVDILGRDIEKVNDKLQYALTFEAMRVIIEDFLLERLRKLKPLLPIDRVLPIVIRDRGLVKIDQLACQACVSIRQLERLFQQRVGLPPKHFSRLVRFAHAWILKEERPEWSWLKIAHECGYFDQMHLIRDFHEFAGVNPSYIESDFLNSQLRFFNRLHH